MSKIVVCKSGSKFLKKGQHYIAINENENFYDIKGMTWYHKMNFKDLQEVREDKINKLLEDKS